MKLKGGIIFSTILAGTMPDMTTITTIICYNYLKRKFHMFNKGCLVCHLLTRKTLGGSEPGWLVKIAASEFPGGNLKRPHVQKYK